MPDKPASQRRRGRGPQRRQAEPHNGEPIIITSATELRKICKELREVGSFAFDTEFVMEDVFRPEVCVVQLATENMTAILDPYEVPDLHCVWELIGDPEIEVVVHAGMEDLAICFEQGGITPQNVFDCQIACGLVKTDYPLSLARLTRFLLGVRLKKSQTLTDWRKRPLSEAQVRYAADDVRYLPAARRELGRKLTKRKRIAWAAEEMARFSRQETYVRGTVESVLKLKGAGGLDGEGLAIAHELLAERAKLAARYNRPARAVVRDHLLIEIARHRWTDPAQIKSLRGLNLRAQAVDALAQAVRRASALPPEEWPTPTPPSDETEREAALALLTSAIIHAYCAEEDIAHQLVATKKDVRIFVRALVRGGECPPGVALARGWRAEHIASLVQDVFAGRRHAGVIADNGGPHMVVK